MLISFSCESDIFCMPAAALIYSISLYVYISNLYTLEVRWVGHSELEEAYGGEEGDLAGWKWYFAFYIGWAGQAEAGQWGRRLSCRLLPAVLHHPNQIFHLISNRQSRHLTSAVVVASGPLLSSFPLPLPFPSHCWKPCAVCAVGDSDGMSQALRRAVPACHACGLCHTHL